MKPVRATESVVNKQSDAVPVGHHRTWVLAFVMPPLHYKSIVTTILHYFGRRRRKCWFEYLLHEFHHLFRNFIDKVYSQLHWEKHNLPGCWVISLYNFVF